MPHWVLTSDWTDYESRKTNYEERSYFSCESLWEVDYLVNKIRTFNPDLVEAEIREAITASCRTIKAPRSRSVFVIAVMKKLREPLNNITRIHNTVD